MLLTFAVGVIGSIVAGYFIAPEYVVHRKGYILISGASSGIGRHASQYLADRGYHVLMGVRKQEDFMDIENMNNDLLVPVMLDVTSHSSCLHAVKAAQTLSQSSGLPFVALVNNAGISRRSVAEFHNLSDAREVFDTNFFGMVDLTQLTLPLLRTHKGRVLMISSIAGVFGK